MVIDGITLKILRYPDTKNAFKSSRTSNANFWADLCQEDADSRSGDEDVLGLSAMYEVSETEEDWVLVEEF